MNSNPISFKSFFQFKKTEQLTNLFDVLGLPLVASTLESGGREGNNELVPLIMSMQRCLPKHFSITCLTSSNLHCNIIVCDEWQEWKEQGNCPIICHAYMYVLYMQLLFCLRSKLPDPFLPSIISLEFIQS